MHEVVMSDMKSNIDDVNMAVSILFVCHKIHKDPALNIGRIKPYVSMKKARIIAGSFFFIGITTLPGPNFHSDGWGLG